MADDSGYGSGFRMGVDDLDTSSGYAFVLARMCC
jgi:hypothetical protein